MPIAAPTRGCAGIVQIATTYSGAYTAVGRLSDWSFNTTAERIDASIMGSCTKSYVNGAAETTGTISAQWDGDDSIQTSLRSAVTAGTALFLRIYPEGTGSGANFYRSTTSGVRILGVDTNGNGVDGIVASSFSFAANGGLTATAVP
jgi:hypothetical protein